MITSPKSTLTTQKVIFPPLLIPVHIYIALFLAEEETTRWSVCMCVLVEVVRRGINLHFLRQEHRLGRRKDKSQACRFTILKLATSKPLGLARAAHFSTREQREVSMVATATATSMIHLIQLSYITKIHQYMHECKQGLR